jgi:hypothetical protein
MEARMTMNDLLKRNHAMEEKRTFQSRIKEVEPIAEEIYKAYVHSEIARKLLRKHSIEEIRQMTETEILTAIEIDGFDAALIVVCAEILADPKSACRHKRSGAQMNN